eukprot:2045874-Pleurochrysis_carterae.AAC.1
MLEPFLRIARSPSISVSCPGSRSTLLPPCFPDRPYHTSCCSSVTCLQTPQPFSTSPASRRFFLPSPRRPSLAFSPNSRRPASSTTIAPPGTIVPPSNAPGWPFYRLSPPQAALLLR